MPNYQYLGEYSSVTIENVKLVQGQNEISIADEQTLLKSGFGQAMLKQGELVKVDGENDEISIVDEQKEMPTTKVTKKSKDEG